MRRRSALLTAAAALLASSPVALAAPVPDYVPGEVLVRFAPGADAGERAAALAAAGGRVAARLGADRRLVRLHDQGVATAVHRLAASPGVLWAEPNWLYRRQALPNDPALGQQWALANGGQSVQGVSGVAGADIKAAGAWDLTTGSPAVRLAVIDGGVDVSHPDLAPNATTPANPDETGDGRESNGVDDDLNGLVDDWRGWDFVAADNDPRDDDSVSHGTHVAGVAAARGNDGAGVAGVSWQARLIAVRAVDANGEATAAQVAAGFAYAADRGARIAVASFGGPAFSQQISDAIADAPNMLVVTAAGNDGENVDATGRNFPCALPLPNIICVAATDQRDELASFSNYGTTSVDLAAPGVSILSSVRGGGFRYLDGTSFSAPMVAGAAALVLAAQPVASTAQLRGALLAGVKPLPSLAGRTVTGGRLDAQGALLAIPPAAPGPGVSGGPPVDIGESVARITGSVVPRGQRTAWYFEWGTTPAYGAQTPTRRLGSANGAQPVSDALTRLTRNKRYHYRLVAADAGGITYGPDTSFVPGAAAASLRRPAPPTVAIRRAGRRWFVVLRAPTFTVLSGRLQRRLARHRARLPVRYRTIVGLRRRGYAAGVRRIALGRLIPGRHRVVLTLTSASGTERVTRAFRVTSPRPRVSSQPRSRDGFRPAGLTIRTAS